MPSLRVNPDVLYRLRYDAGLTQAELAKAAGRDQSVISRLEAGEFATSHPSTIKALADALGVTVAELCADTEEDAA